MTMLPLQSVEALSVQCQTLQFNTQQIGSCMQAHFRQGIFTSATLGTVEGAIPRLEKAAGPGPPLFDRSLILHRCAAASGECLAIILCMPAGSTSSQCTKQMSHSACLITSVCGVLYCLMTCMAVSLLLQQRLCVSTSSTAFGR